MYYDKLKKNHITMWCFNGKVYPLKKSISAYDLKEIGGQDE